MPPSRSSAGLRERAAPPDHDPRQTIVGRLTHEAALRGERLVCVCRFVFCALVLIRFWALHLAVPAHATALKVTMSVGAMGFSTWMWLAIRNGRCTPRALRLSVVADAVMCCACLLGTTIWPGIADYGGLLTRPEPMSILVMVYTAGFRFSPRLAGLGGVGNALSAAILLVVDRAVATQPLRYGAPEIFFFGLAVASAAVLAIATAIITRRLVEAVSRETVRVEGVRNELTDIIRDQHDAKTLLSTATLNADLVRLTLQEAMTTSGDRGAITLVEDLRRALEILSGSVLRLSDRAAGQLAVLREPSVVDATQVISAALPVLRARFPRVDIEVSLEPLLAGIRILGGRSGLERALFNLVLNAVEGDGHRGAKRIWLVTRASGRAFNLVVQDDGPGFPEDGRQRIVDARLSRKPNGSGFALFGLAQLAEASGGRLEIGNGPGWGAEVTLTLPIATDAPLSTPMPTATPTPTPIPAPVGAPDAAADPLRCSAAKAS